MKHIIIFITVILGFINAVFAYPIPKRPLRQLVIESQYIIVGYVIKTYDKENNIKEENGKVVIRTFPFSSLILFSLS